MIRFDFIINENIKRIEDQYSLFLLDRERIELIVAQLEKENQLEYNKKLA